MAEATCWPSFGNELTRVAWIQTILSVVALLCVLYISGLVHVWSDDRAAEYPTGFVVKDLGWELLPRISYVQIANFWLACAVAATWAALIVYYATSFHLLAMIFRRVMWLLAGIFLLRACTIFVTTFPQPPHSNQDTGLYTPSNPGLGALLIAVGARSSKTDLVFSGHTTVFVLHACLWWTYIWRMRRYQVPDAWRLAYCFAATFFCAVGPLLMIAVRWHQTVDVVLAVVITLGAYYIYHDLVKDHRRYYGVLAWLDGTPRELLVQGQRKEVSVA